MQAKPSDVSAVIKKYVDLYQSETKITPHNRNAFIVYRLENADVAMMAPDFIRADRSFVEFFFLSLRPMDFERHIIEYSIGNFYPTKNFCRDGKMNLHMDIDIPTTNSKVCLATINEVVCHELMHAYRFCKEYYAGHYSKSKRKKHTRPPKYTTTERFDAYCKIMPNKRNSELNDFRWVGYILTNDEIYANLAGLRGFLYEMQYDTETIKYSAFFRNLEYATELLSDIKQYATDKTWQRVMKTTSYLSPLKNETLSHFKHRWIKYYENQLKIMNKKMIKIVERHVYELSQQSAVKTK